MVDDIKILTFQPDLSGFFRLAVELPSGNTKQKISVSGVDRGNDFIVSDEVIICSSVHIDTYPSTILINDDFILSNEKIKVSFDTYSFTPTGIYATLGIVNGDNVYQTLIHDENKITDFTWSNYGNKNTFTFDFPQNGKLSDIIDATNMPSSSQPLIIILEMKDNNYSVNNFKQLSSNNIINNFSSPIRFIKSSDFVISMDSILGDEDIAGLINFRLSISKINAFGIVDSTAAISENKNPNDTNIEFSNYKNTYADFLTSSLSTKYQSNKEVGLLKSGILFIKESVKNKSFLISKSRHSEEPVGYTNITIDGNIKDKLFNNDGTIKEVIVSDFLPLSYRIKSDREDYSEERKLKINSITNGQIAYEPIYAGGSILDDGDLYIELIDNITGASIIKNIGPSIEDRSKVLTSTTSNVSDAYHVSYTFYEKLDLERGIFWKPILPASDGTIGMSNSLNVIYIRLESNREIKNIQGYLALGNNIMDIILQETGNEGNNQELISNTFIFNNDNNVGYIIIDFDSIVQTAIEQNLLITSDIKISDDKGNTFTIRF